MAFSPFLKFLGIHSLVLSLLLLIGVPILYSQVKDVMFNLNLAKNREQAERIATLASIDLEQGIPSSNVLSKIQYMLENTPQSAEHFACIVEDENKVVAHPNPTSVNKDVTGWTLKSESETKTYTQSAGEGIPFGGVQTRLDGSQDVTFQVPISTMPWSVAVHTKLDLVEEQTMIIIKRFILVFLPIVIILVLISSFLLTKNELKS